jgi:hypothetical protein
MRDSQLYEWQNEAKMLNLFNATIGPLRCGLPNRGSLCEVQGMADMLDAKRGKRGGDDATARVIRTAST